MIKHYRIYIAVVVITSLFSFLFSGCDGEPVFTEMATNRLKIVIKGTLESEGGSNFNDMAAYSADTTNANFQDDSVDDNPSSSDNELPTQFMLDLAEIRLGGEKIANYRQVFKFDLTGDGSTVPFFNGNGVVLKNDDPPEGRYDTVQVYIRKMVFDNAEVYSSSGSGFTHSGASQVIFHEETVNGFDFNQLMVNSYWDSLRLESAEILRIFPLQVPIVGGLDYNRYDPETVLEIRFVVKNFVKKYEYDYYSGGVYKVSHYYAFSDWLRDVRGGEYDIGRNIHAVARAYVPGKTGTATVNGVANQYVIMIPESEDIADYYITDTGVNLRDANDYDFPLPPRFPGAYIEAVLDYYLKYEKYEYDWQTKYDLIAGIPDFDGYQAEWNIYEESVKNFKVAPYVKYGSSPIVFNNVAPGRYKVYSAAKPTYGNLFNGAGVFTQIGVVKEVTANNDTTFP